MIVLYHKIDLNMEQTTEYLTINKVAKLLGVTTMTLRKWDRDDKLKAYRNPINNYRIYKKADIDKFLDKIEQTKS